MKYVFAALAGTAVGIAVGMALADHKKYTVFISVLVGTAVVFFLATIDFIVGCL